MVSNIAPCRKRCTKALSTKIWLPGTNGYQATGGEGSAAWWTERVTQGGDKARTASRNCAQISGRDNARQAVCTALAEASGEWWAAKRTIDPGAEFSNSGQSGTLSRLAERRKIAAASAISLECRDMKFKTCSSILRRRDLGPVLAVRTRLARETAK